MQRQNVLSLYRTILKTAKNWQAVNSSATQQERQYIREVSWKKKRSNIIKKKIKFLFQIYIYFFVSNI